MVKLGGKIRVAVLMGGISSERDVSLSTGKQILEALDRSRYDVIGVDAGVLPGQDKPGVPSVDEKVDALIQARDALLDSSTLMPLDFIMTSDGRPDVAIIALHGRYGEDGTIQGMLEILGIPYTGSGVLASALAMDKSMAKKVMAADGVPVPKSVDFMCRNSTWNRGWVYERVSELGYPVIVKPSRQGSTIGMTKVDDPAKLEEAIDVASRYDTRILVEEFVEGIELTVGVLGNEEPFPLPVIEIVPAKGFYDYEAKYTPGATEEIVPARIPREVAFKVQKFALTAHTSLGCSGMSRVDIIYVPGNGSFERSGIESNGGERFYVLEVNTVPGMTPTSLLPRAAQAAGISFSQLLDMLIEFALEDGRR
ncbi:MAG: D-alanine--D-alanine ligase [Armatimonadota bacterium]